MIGKIVTGKSFRGAVEYVLGKAKVRLLDSDGVDTASVRTIIDDLNFQRKTRPEIAKAVGHISLAFHKADTPKLTNDLMRELAAAYMERMGITDTQYIVARHSDTEHPHLHIIYNRVRYDGLLVKSHNERFRNVKVCKELKQQYGLTFSQGKENVKVEKLHTPDRIKYEIYEAIKEALPRCASVEDLAAEIFDRNRIRLDLIHRGNDPAKEVQGVTFTKDGITFKGSQIDRKFSYGGLVKAIDEENRKREQERQNTVVRSAAQQQNAVEIVRPTVPERPKIDRIENYCLSPDEQRRLYSPEGLTLIRTMKDERQTIRYSVNRDNADRDILVQGLLSTEKINRNPSICGIQLTDEQVAQVKDGQFLYMDNLKDKEGRAISKYVIADDQLTRFWLRNERPDQWVKYGRYEMRLMDKLLIENGCIAHAVVKW